MSYQYVIYKKEGNIATITFNKPEKLNTFQYIGRGEDVQDIYKALKEAEDDDEVKVVVFNAAGRAFGTGHDLTKVGFLYGFGTGQEGERRPSQRIRLKKDREGLCDDFQKILYCNKITVASVHGYCLGGGCITQMLCDITIASDDAVFGWPEHRLGFAGQGLIEPLVLHVGLKRAREIFLTGKHISAQEALKIGLINKVVPRDKLEQETQILTEALCLLPADGIAVGKAFTHLAYDRLGITSSFIENYIGHTMFTNVRWEPGEYNFFKHRRDEGAKQAFHERDARYTGKV